MNVRSFGVPGITFGLFAFLCVAGCDTGGEEPAKTSRTVQQKSESNKKQEPNDPQKTPSDKDVGDAQKIADTPETKQSDAPNVSPAIDDPPSAILSRQEKIDWLKNPTIEIKKDWVHLFEGKELWIDKESKTVIVGGVVFMQAGPLEMFICPGRTKKHESIVGSNALASEVHAGLLALGIEPGQPANWNEGYVPAWGPKIDIEMKWRDKESGEIKSMSAKEWIRNTDTKEKMKANFVFGGSVIFKDPDSGKNFYLGDDGELVCLSNFSTATVDISVTSTQENMDLLFEVFPGKVPPIGTHVYAFITAGEIIGKSKKKAGE